MKRVQDHYFKMAKQQGYPARSVYKLKEAQAKYGFIRPGFRVLDLGAAPGSWARYACKLVGVHGEVVAVDLRPLSIDLPACHSFTMDVFELDARALESALGRRPCFHVVLSDMAPKTTGRKDVDHWRQMALAQRALDIAREVLGPGGSFFCKVFQGEELPGFRKRCQEAFGSVKVFKPKSSRPESVELFLMCLGFEKEKRGNR